MPTQLEVAKEALAQVGTRSSITALNDGSTEANYINLLYAPIRDFLMAEGDYDFTLNSAALVRIGPGPTPWANAYSYPASALRIRQLVPTVFDINDPRPVTWNSSTVGGVKQILTQELITTAIYTYAAAETLWDPLFEQAFVRMLASALAFALENRIEASKVKLEEALSFAGVANMRDE